MEPSMKCEEYVVYRRSRSSLWQLRVLVLTLFIRWCMGFQGTKTPKVITLSLGIYRWALGTFVYSNYRHVWTMRLNPSHQKQFSVKPSIT